MTTQTLAEARSWLRDRIDDGEHCPCCTQLAKVYRRKIHATMGRDLILVWHRFGPAWFHSTASPAHGGDFVKLTHWGLIAEDDRIRDDGGRAGWWQITPNGVAYVQDRLKVPKYARIYDGRCLGLVGDPVGVRDALGTRFDYRDLMAGR